VSAIHRLAAIALANLGPFHREVTRRFGLILNFFMSTPDAPEIVERLRDFAKSTFLDSPIPSLFKERLFVFLSRFCQVRYCIIRPPGVEYLLALLVFIRAAHFWTPCRARSDCVGSTKINAEAAKIKSSISLRTQKTVSPAAGGSAHCDVQRG
jgi:hypothetical protein